ncbi:MAG: NUDIX hydrolase [Candidatus Micrarchaeota archaeon]|nr:NUDIX hydrolase [Candidatus Micrarchaeota archaeon]
MKEKLVYKGPIFRVYQWKQRMFDGTYKTFERAERPSSAEIIAVVGGRIAIAEERQPGGKGFIGLIGGRIDEGETPLAAAKRELLEEAGMRAAGWKILRAFKSSSKKLKWDVYLLAALDCRRVGSQKLDSGERIKVRYITLEELLDWGKDTARIGPDIALYFNELRHDRGARRRLERILGL